MTWTTRPRSEGGGGLQFFAQGRGVPLVLIHGVGLRGEAWNAVLPFLSPRFYVCAIDMPGHGGSPLDNSATLADFTHRCADFIDTLDQPAYVAGHSMGALIALRLSVDLSHRIRGVAALNPVFRRSPKAARAVQARAKALTETGAPDPTDTLHRWFGAAPVGDAKAASEACRAWLTGGNAQGYAAAYRIFAREDGPTAEQLNSISCSALFMTGAQDPNSTPAMSDALAAACGGVSRVVPDAAHMLPMTHPGALASALCAHFSPDPTRS